MATAADVLPTADQVMAEVRALPPDPNKLSTTTLVAIAQDGPRVTVQQRYETRTVKLGANGVRHKVLLVAESTDTWIEWEGTWLQSMTVTDDLSYSVDGAEVAHKFRN